MPSRLIEHAGRICWKSEGSIKEGSAGPFCERVVRGFGHESIAEHASATMLFVTDRIVSHQIVRHRIAAYSQESTHYINYTNARHDGQIRVCKPHGLVEGSPAFYLWEQAMISAESRYFQMIQLYGARHYEARYVLPMGLKTELVATYNFRTWRHVIDTRTKTKPDGRPVNTPETHNLFVKAARIMAVLCPELFDDYKTKEELQ